MFIKSMVITFSMFKECDCGEIVFGKDENTLVSNFKGHIGSKKHKRRMVARAKMKKPNTE